MSGNGIVVPLTIIIDKDGAIFNKTNYLSSYDICCNTSESNVHIKWDILNILKEFKPLTKDEDITHVWVTLIS